jgi:hypothetical protein
VDLNSKRWRFTREMIADAPAHSGIYALWHGDKLLRLGCARGGQTIRGKLLAYLQASAAPITHYSWEITRSPVQRAREIVRALDGPR